MKPLYSIFFAVIFLLVGCSNEIEKEKQSVHVIEAESEINITPSTIENIIDMTKLSEGQENPLHYNSYNINLDINTETRGIKGFEKVRYKNVTGEDLKNIYFHLYFNAFSATSKTIPYFKEFEDKIFKYGEDKGIMDIKSVHINNEEVSFEQSDTILKIILPKTLKNLEETEITIQFNSYIPKIAHRTGANDKAIWLGNYIPILCKYNNSTWRTDSYYPAGDPFYSDISNYEVKITAPKEYKVIGTGKEIISESSDNNNKTITTLNAEMVRDFAFVVSKDYKTNSIKTENGINIKFHHYSDNMNIDKIMSLAEKSINYYSSKVGSYPYSELDIVETELFFNGGMEYPSLIMMDSEYLQTSKDLSSIVHEVGHQWFYNIIGNDQINEAWIDEGLNSYLQEVVLYSEEEIDNRMNIQYNNLIEKLKDINKKNLNSNLKHYENWNSYYYVQYIRSKFMIYSLHQKMGSELFDTFLKTYYKKYAFKEVTSSEFIKTAEEVYGQNLTQFFKQWIENDKIPPLGGN